MMTYEVCPKKMWLKKTLVTERVSIIILGNYGKKINFGIFSTMKTILCLPQSDRLVRVMTHLELPDIDIEKLLFNGHVLNEYVDDMMRQEESPLRNTPPLYFEPDAKLNFHPFNELLSDLGLRVNRLVYIMGHHESLHVDLIIGAIKS